MNRSRWASRAHYGQEVSTSEPVYYTERVRVPFSYWAIALFFGLTFVPAVTFMLGDAVLIASTLTATALIGVAKSAREVVRSMAEIGDHAKQAGVGAEAFQAWSYVAKQSRIDVDALTDGFKSLQSNWHTKCITVLTTRNRHSNLQ